MERQTLAKQSANEIFVRDDCGHTAMGLRVETKLGDLIAYPSTDPEHPGISVVYRPNGKTTEIDLTYAEVCENDASDDAVHVYCYKDVSDEGWTDEFSIHEKEALDAMEYQD